MADPKKQVDIRAFFGSNAAKPALSQNLVSSTKTEATKSVDQKPIQKSTSKASSIGLEKRPPTKPKAKISTAKRGVAVTKKKSAKEKKPAATKKAPSKRSRKKRRTRDEEEEYDSDFITSDDSDDVEDSESDKDAKPKQTGRKRIIVCSDNEDDNAVEVFKDEELEEKSLVNQPITKFVSMMCDKSRQPTVKTNSVPETGPCEEVSSKSFFAAASKPKIIKPSSAPPSEILLKGSASKTDMLSSFTDDDFAIDDEMLADIATDGYEPKSAIETMSPMIVSKENIQPPDSDVEQKPPNFIDNGVQVEPGHTAGSAVAEAEAKDVTISASAASTNPIKPAKKWYPGQQRAAPKLLGQKLIPKGEPNCLSGKRFVLTGVLDSLERDSCSDLIKSLGGAVTGAVSGKTTHLVVGDEPSEKKLDEAKKRKIVILDEDGLFQLISNSKSVAVAELPTVKINVAVPEHGLTSLGSSPSPMWVDKYKPVSSSDLCANPGVIEKLRKFLTNWPNTEEGKHAVLLSGPPGIGKSSSAVICAKEAGYNAVELNASTTRSKKALSEHVKELLQCHSISEYFDANAKPKKQNLHKTVLIMDEVDGMSGGDRGGMQELYSLIKSTKVPIICICNDRSSPKVKTLANYCIDLRFRRPMANQVTQRLLSIAKAEGLNVDQNVLAKLVETTRGDLRQMLNTMQLWRTSSKAITFHDVVNAPTKDFENSPFDLAPDLFRPISPHISDWISSRMDIYFCDPSLIPLMVQGNYLNCIPQLTPKEASQNENKRELSYLEHFAEAATSISDGDLVEARLRYGQAWSLMPVHAVLSTVAPGVQIAGRLQGRIEFPQWLGKNATYGKNMRLLSEVHSHVMGRLNGTSAKDLNLDYLPVLRRRIVDTLLKHGADGIDETVAIMNKYNLTRSDLDTVFELGEGISGKLSLNGKVKSALTRALTQRSTAVVSSRSKARSAPTMSDPLRLEDDIVDDDAESFDDQSEIEVKPEVPVASKKPGKSKSASSAKRKSTGKSASAPKRSRAK